MTTQRNHTQRRHLAVHNLQSTIHNLQSPNSPSTGIDTMRQSSTKHNENSCAHARDTAFPPPVYVIPASPLVIPAPSHVIPAKAGIPRAQIDRTELGIDIH